MPRAELERRLRELEAQRRALREQENSLQETLRARDRYANLYDFAPITYLTLDGFGVVKEINLTGASLLGRSRDRLIGRPLRRFIQRADHATFSSYMQRCRDSASELAIELHMFGKSGSFLAQLNTHRMSDSSELRQMMYSMAIIDLSEYRRAEEKRTESMLREHTSRAAAQLKDQLIAMVSHELRTPLTSILLWVKILRRKLSPELQQQHAQAIEAIERSAESQRQLIDDLLDVSAIAAGKMHLDIRSVELEPLLRKAIEATSPAAESKQIHIELSVGTDLGGVRADPNRLRQVVWNLTNNAVKFTPAGGRVQIHARRVADEVEIRVQDTGCGIDTDFLPFVFQAFRQADASITTRVHGGLGLGLAICKQLVEQHGGTIQASSPGAGQGATFTVRMPRRPLHESAGSAPRPARTNAPTQLDGLHVLLVEDEDETRNALVTLVREAGAEVLAVDSTEAAINAFLRARPDLVLGDIGMSGQDGYSLMERLRAMEQQGSHVPALALTAYTRDADRERALRAGFDRYLGKPIEPALLLSTMRDLAGRPAS